MAYAIVGVLALLADQLIKYYTVTHISLNIGIQDVLPGVFHLTNIKNFGAMFGVLQNASWLRWALLILLLAFTAAMAFAYVRGLFRTGFSRWTGALLLAGLLGNGIDRAIYGYVVDMLELEFINFAIFNLADMLVIVCGILFCISLLVGGLRPAEEEEEEEEEEEVRPAPRRAAPTAPAAEAAPVRPRRAVEAEAPVPSRRVAPRSFENETPVRPRRTAAPQSELNARAAVEEAEGVVRTVRRPAPRSAEPVSEKEPVRPAAPATPARPAAPAAPARPAAPTAPVRPAAPAAAAPARPAAPAAPAPAVKSAAPAADEFDLDSILAEFK